MWEHLSLRSPAGVGETGINVVAEGSSVEQWMSDNHGVVQDLGGPGARPRVRALKKYHRPDFCAVFWGQMRDNPGHPRWFMQLRVFVDVAWRCFTCLLYTSPSPRDQRGSRMPSSA